MLIRGLIDEDFVNYKKTSMYIAFPYCTFKCEKECGIPGICQNCDLAKSKIIDVTSDTIVTRYINNKLTHSVVFAGLEPLDSWEDLLELVAKFRERTDDDIVIYTGYYKKEIEDKIKILKQFKNIIIKFGRFVPNKEPHIDSVIGVKLMNPEQYAEKIS